MQSILPTSLATALAIPTSSSDGIQLSPDISYGDVSLGGYIACVMTKYALQHAAQHPIMRGQPDIHASTVQFYRPVLTSKVAAMKVHEVSIGKGWSTLRIELFQTDKIAASVDATLTNFAMPNVNLQTGWTLSPPSTPVDLSKLESDGDPRWVSYQTAFHPDGFRRASSYVKTFIPKDWPTDIGRLEQWVLPGWDCFPQGSCAAETEADKARWTTDMIQFVVDMGLPVQENLYPTQPGKPLPMASVAAILGFSAAQKKARLQGVPRWRELDLDGSKRIMAQSVHVTLKMSTEIKKNLPADGTRWLYMRTEAKRIVDGRLDMEVLLFDQDMQLIAISNHVGQIIPASRKMQKKAQL
ncbi:thioesterase-like superfamily-domain-containing protein [Penicillium capsulatum]|uniref:Thioesterase-like superfamily-domain-containing protein n=1 Tax=Penicillium capsulatum TaxID=69766 RepID=A0A9W9IK05_9EURO|nr:thioesterase-like superfamily-domain-containing protein [Penicillium capsulatum]KAJ6121670.1 thioesterase-like superfamily-domain-containing protein [Penicillium capsulatum]